LNNDDDDDDDDDHDDDRCKIMQDEKKSEAEIQPRSAHQ
jgi:hypothetical protein